MPRHVPDFERLHLTYMSINRRLTHKSMRYCRTLRLRKRWFWISIQSSDQIPVWLMCLSGECGVRTPPLPLAMAYMNLFVFVYPDGATRTILAHELAHAELHQRVGSGRRFFSQAVPTWFDEGLAVYISQDTRYLDVEDSVVTGCKDGNWPQPPSDQRTFRRLGATEAEAIL